jgi:hypothetical protein
MKSGLGYIMIGIIIGLFTNCENHSNINNSNIQNIANKYTNDSSYEAVNDEYNKCLHKNCEICMLGDQQICVIELIKKFETEIETLSDKINAIPDKENNYNFKVVQKAWEQYYHKETDVMYSVYYQETDSSGLLEATFQYDIEARHLEILAQRRELLMYQLQLFQDKNPLEQFVLDYNFIEQDSFVLNENAKNMKYLLHINSLEEIDSLKADLDKRINTSINKLNKKTSLWKNKLMESQKLWKAYFTLISESDNRYVSIYKGTTLSLMQRINTLKWYESL